MRRRLLTVIMATAVACASDDFADVKSAHIEFCRVNGAFRAYAKHLSALPLTYDANSTESPPFDMYYHLEHLHRSLGAARTWVSDAAASWTDIGLSCDERTTIPSETT